MRAYYNDNDKQSTAWLGELVKAGVIFLGNIDDQSIADVRGADLRGYGRVHFFAGIGGWDYALTLAGWPPDRDVWTGSCPCQPLSGAGKRKGEKDERHLWPEFYRLISECHPPTVFGEQVASRDGREWLTGVRADLEALGYAVGVADLCAAGEGAPHIRQRLYWVANSNFAGQYGRPPGGQQPIRDELYERNSGVVNTGHSIVRAEHGHECQECRDWPRESSTDSGMADSETTERRRTDDENNRGWRIAEVGGHGTSGGLGDTIGEGCEGSRPELPQRRDKQLTPESGGGYWSNSILIPCGDGKARRIEPGISPLVNGLPGRVGLLRGYGNAIVPQVAAKFIRAFMEAMNVGN